MRFFSRIKYSLSIGVLLIWSVSIHAEDMPNYCHDAETNAYWEDLKIRAADNFKVVNLANVREELCQKVDDGELSVEEATNLFELERARVVDELKRGQY